MNSKCIYYVCMDEQGASLLKNTNEQSFAEKLRSLLIFGSNSRRYMVYIGDSETDIPCMKLVNSYGGHSIGVYDPETGNTDRVHKMIRDNRIRYYVPADYSEGSEMDTLIKAIVDKTAAVELLEDKYNKDLAAARSLTKA